MIHNLNVINGGTCLTFSFVRDYAAAQCIVILHNMQMITEQYTVFEKPYNQFNAAHVAAIKVLAKELHQVATNNNWSLIKF